MATDILVINFDGALKYKLLLRGEFSGNDASLTSKDAFTFQQVVVTAGDDNHLVLRAILPKPFDIPRALIDDAGTRLLTKAEVDAKLAAETEQVRERFKAIRAEALRRLRTVEVDWNDKTIAGSEAVFFDTTAAVNLRGQVKLALGLIVGTDETDIAIAGATVAEVRASVEVMVTINNKQFERRYGIVVRFAAAAAATISLDFDDLNISLPELTLPSFDFSSPIKVPNVSLDTVAKNIGGAFSSLARHFNDFKVTHKWTTQTPTLVIRRNGSSFLFAITTNDTIDLSNPVAENDLAALTVKVERGAFSWTTDGIKVARHSGGLIAVIGTSTVNGQIDVDDGTRTIGPLLVEWRGVHVKPAVDLTGRTASANVKFERLLIHPIDDPSAVIAFRGEIEINISGVRVLELELVEPYPFVLVHQAAEAVLHTAQKIIQLLGQIRPQTSGDIEGLKKVLAVLGRIAAAVARAAYLVLREVGNELAGAAEFFARAVVKLAQLLVELVKKIADLLASASAPSDIQIDVEVRIALEPLELRQVMLTMHGPAVEGGMANVSALGFQFAIPTGWRPAVLVDFVTEPGAYLLVLRPQASAVGDPFAVVSTDLWLKRSDTVAPQRDASTGGERDKDQPLIKLTVLRNTTEPFALMIAGISRGNAVFLRYASNAVTQKKVPIPGGNTVDVAVVPGPFALLPLDQNLFTVNLDFQKDRVLPLLGMGEAGKDASSGTGPSFLKRLQDSIGQVVWVKDTKFDPAVKTKDGRRYIAATIVLGVKAAGVETSLPLDVELDLDTLEVTFAGVDTVFPLKSKRIEERALGLTWVVEQADETKRKNDEEVEMFQLTFSGSESGFALTKEARMQLRFDGLSSDGQGVVFEVEKFLVGRGGLDLIANVSENAVRLNGIDVPFRFTTGRIEIAGSKLVGASITGRGQLPPALVGEANCTAALVFGLENGEIALQSGKVELDKKGEPIVCHETRFTLTITDVDIAFVREGGYHFYFLVSGSMRFTPKTGEFESGLLQNLEDIEITLERTPLTADPRVLLRHVSFQKALNPKKTFPLFNIFTFELRGFGFHPASPKFEGHPPAVNISGQIRFAELGDVMQPKIDFHELWIAPPKAGEALPRIKAEGLGVELQLAGSVKIRGAVLAVDPDTRTVEGREFAPPGYNTSGFLGEGAVDIPGFAALEASLGFLEVEKQDDPGNRKKAFFLYLQADKLAVEIPTPIWTFYLREVGFGFGYRYTLAGIKDAENAKSTAQLVKTLDDVSRRQGDLARFTAWKPDPEKDNFTLALRGAFQLFPAEKTYDEEAEKSATSPLFFDIVAALRSDFTFLMSARGWLGVNYATFLENKDNFREKPTFRGYLYISVPRSELLLRGIADSQGFIGSDWAEVMPGTQLRLAVQSVDWTTTLYIRPGLFHFEMGWPDQLSVRLIDKPNMRVAVRGGMIFRAADDGILYGFNIVAEAFMRFEGRVGDSIGVALVAELNARLVARVLAFLAARFKGSLVYGLVSLDARLTFSVEAWMDVDLGFTSFTIRIGFSFSVQFTAVVELAISDDGVGGKVRAAISVQVFGCTLGVGIGFSFNDGKLAAARARVERFLALSITAEEPDSPPVFVAKSGDKAIESTAGSSEAVHQAPEPPNPAQPQNGLKPPINRSQFGRDVPLGSTNFWMVLRKATFAPGLQPAPDGYAYALLVPKEARSEVEYGFYAAPAQKDDFGHRAEDKPVHTVNAPNGAVDKVQYWKPGNTINGTLGGFEAFTGGPIFARWNAPIAVAGAPDGTFTLAYFFDECFLSDTEWRMDGNTPVRVAKKWSEPKTLRVHERKELPVGTTQEARNQGRDVHQKSRVAEAITNPYDERAFQARSTALTMFLDQFVTFSEHPTRSDPAAHVTDLGLVFYGPVEQLANLKKIIKHEGTDHEGDIAILNEREHWFERDDPALANDRSAVQSDGIKLDWRLTASFDPEFDPEHLLHHYEILRTIEGFDFTQQVIRVKPAATVGARDQEDTKSIALVPPDWQFVDTLEDVEKPDVRRALLPSAGEADALAAATAWLGVFGGDEEVTITYSVTPVDIAGTRGLPRAFVIDVRRPQPPIHPAVAELRVVQTLRNGKNADTDPMSIGAQRSDEHPDDLQVFLAVNDRAWRDDADETVTIEGIKYSVERIYRLIADPDDIEPAGHYGSDAATSRVRGPGAFVPQRTADEQTFEISRNATSDVTKNKEARAVVAAAETDDSELKRLPLWALMDAKKLDGAKKAAFTDVEAEKFLRFLWDGTTSDKTLPRRIATHFFLETVITLQAKKGPRIEHVSKRVAVPVEHLIDAGQLTERSTLNDQALAAVRPQAFEWAVPLAFPPLAMGQTRTESGFARFRVPKDDARLSALVKGKGIDIERDADRRVLTTVSFAGVPDWVTTGDSKKPRPLHGTSIAGYDLYELDLDDLAPLDIASSQAALESNATAWQRARRVARIEHVSAEDAQLVPAGNFDWQGWHAHYPSETLRINRARLDDDNQPRRDSKPVLATWYSERESTPQFAARRPRLRLLPDVPETAIAELMRGGRPKRVIASLGAFELTLPDLTLHSVKVGAVVIGAKFNQIADPKRFVFGKIDGEILNPAELRNLLLCLGWKPFAASDPALVKWLANPAFFDKLTLTIEAEGDFVRTLNDGQTTETRSIVTGRVSLPLNLHSPLHPILEETLADLALDIRDDVSAYRRYVVMPQPVTPVAATDFAALMAGTAPEADPYAWHVLQLLGEATTVRLFDAAEEHFVEPQALVERVGDALGSTLARWRVAYEDNAIFGQPFVDVFLRPGADRLAGPFDAVIKNAIETEPAAPLTLSDHGLAFVQMTLRPRPVAVWTYMRQPFHWRSEPANPGARLRSVSLQAAVVRDIDFARTNGGPIEEIAAGKTGRIPLPLPTSRTLFKEDADPDPELAIDFRVPFRRESRPQLTVILEWERVDGAKIQIESQERPLGAADCPIGANGSWQRQREPAWNYPDAFGRFQNVSAERWTAAFQAEHYFVGRIYETLRQVLTAAGMAFPKREDYGTVVAGYLPWAQRLLDYSASTREVIDNDPCFSLAAPAKATPWKLAADAEGQITLSFLHSDRWAHARAYAVKPIPRYHEVLNGIGVPAQTLSESLTPATQDGKAIDDVGFAVAVSPRTERIEAPVIVPWRLIGDDANVEPAKFIVARHGEESLAASNRPLLARLGLPTSLLSFTRSYRMPGWPEKLKSQFGTPLAQTLPQRKAALPDRPAMNSSPIDGAMVKKLSHELPSLWKGADIWRVDPIPPHFRLIALASERAGVVVSDIATVVVEEQPRKPLAGRANEVLPLAEVKLERVDGKVRLVFSHSLVSHKQLTPSPADHWFKDVPDTDVCFWPDPDVVYLLTRRLSPDDVKFVVVEEDADTRLVNLSDGEQPPVLVRARGPRYKAAVDGGGEQQVVVTTSVPQDRIFQLAMALEPRENAPPDRLKLAKDEYGKFKEDIASFNEKAKNFAKIVTPHLVTIDVPAEGDTGAQYLVRLGILRDTLKARIPATLGANKEPWFDGRLMQELLQRTTRLEEFVAAANPALPAADLRNLVGFPFVMKTSWLRDFPPPDLLPANPDLRATYTFTENEEGQDPGVFLVVFDLAASTEIDGVKAIGIPLTKEESGRLYLPLGRRILGTTSGFWLQAIDTRTRITPATTPGVTERKVKVDTWLASAAAAITKEAAQ